MKDKILSELVTAGREMAISWLHSAVTDAKDESQMENQIFVLRVAATYMLATIVYNEVARGSDPIAALEKIRHGLEIEYDSLVESQDQDFEVFTHQSETPVKPRGTLH